MQSDIEDPLVQCQFNLPTHQRRLRHLQSITVRNLVYPNSQGIDAINLQVYFTLHKDSKSEALYTSEKITGSVNPTWQSFDLQRSDSDADLTSKFVVARVWVGVPNQFRVKIEWHVHLSGLVLFSDKLQVSGLKHKSDTLLFGLYNHIFCYVDPAVPHPQLEKLVPDVQIPKSPSLHAVLMDQSLLRPSYNTNYLSRIHTVLRAIKQTHASVRRIHSTIEDKLVSSSERSDKLSKREALLIRLRQLRQELLWQQQQIQKDEEKVLEYGTSLLGKAQALKTQKNILHDLVTNTEEKRQLHIQSREMLVKENAQVHFRRRQLISDLVQHIYPIRKKLKQDFYICNVVLPNAEEYQGHDENALAVSLGFVCHLVIMVSLFLDMPLRYPMTQRGSRSMVVDHVHSKLSAKDRDFPLFAKGKEKFQYNYGVFLLNKNISQLRFYCGMGTSDLRQTLPNLKSLLEQRLGFISLSPSQRGLNPSSNTPFTSLENSLASHMSLAPSSSSSSFLPHPHYHHHQQQHHHHHHHPHSSHHESRNLHSDRFDLMMLEGQPSAISPDIDEAALIFKNSRQGVESNGGNLHAGMTSTLTSWIETASSMTTTSSHQLNGDSGVEGTQNGAEDTMDGKPEKDDDEKEDLFIGVADNDNFFVPKPIKPSTLLNKLSPTSMRNMSLDSAAEFMKTGKEIGELEEEEERRSHTFVATLSPTPHSSFRFVKPQSKGNNNGDNNGGSCHNSEDNNAIPLSSPSPPSSYLSPSVPSYPNITSAADSNSTNGIGDKNQTKNFTTVTVLSSPVPIRAVSAAVPIPASCGSHASPKCNSLSD